MPYTLCLDSDESDSNESFSPNSQPFHFDSDGSTLTSRFESFLPTLRPEALIPEKGVVTQLEISRETEKNSDTLIKKRKIS